MKVHQSTALERMSITRAWPTSAWIAVVGRFRCPLCGARPGASCTSRTSGKAATVPHRARMSLASAAIVAARDAGKDPRRAGPPATRTIYRKLAHMHGADVLAEIRHDGNGYFCVLTVEQTESDPEEAERLLKDCIGDIVADPLFDNGAP